MKNHPNHWFFAKLKLGIRILVNNKYLAILFMKRILSKTINLSNLFKTLDFLRLIKKALMTNY